MKSQMTFGALRAELHGTGRSREVKLYAPDGLLQKLTVGEINQGHPFNHLSPRQMVLVKKWVTAHRAQRTAVKEDIRIFPTEKQVMHQFMIEMQGPNGVTINQPHGQPGDEDYCEGGDISSKAVTDWYVEKYCTLNHLTK